MSTYQEILNQAQSLSLDEQEHLLKDLTLLVEQMGKTQEQNNSEISPKLNLKRWRGFLPKRVDALAFKVKNREEWDE